MLPTEQECQERDLISTPYTLKKDQQVVLPDTLGGVGYFKSISSEL